MAKNQKSKAHSRSIHLGRLVPNMITIIGLCLGLSAIRLAINEQWETAVLFIIIASVFDGLDGRLARLLDATSEFGAQLDSLADFINFGIAPPFILYMWAMSEVKGFGWGVVLFFAICTSIRLARFNCDLDGDEKPAWSDRFFVGIPAPAGAMLALAPMGITFAFAEDFIAIYDFFAFLTHPIGVSIYAVIISALMSSRLPTFSFKKIKIKRKYSSLVLLLVALIAICALINPWVTMCIIGIWYLSTLPVSIFKYYKLSN